jgi:2-polyprenyl-6-methoxyphenol hydroxylase-like FAD-dependent oxidoreductase
MGAMGLTTGILDSEAIADALELIIHEGKPLGTLDTYSDERRMVFQTFVDPVSTQNKLRCASDVETAQEDWYIRQMAKATPEMTKQGTKPFFGVWRTNMRQSTLSPENA